MIAAVILAAGASRRMGRPKLTLPWPIGRTIIRRVVEVFRAAGAQPIVVVASEDDHDLVAELTGVDVLQVTVPSGGEMLSSVKAGLLALETREAETAFLAPGDHPMLDPATLNALIGAWTARRAPIIAPSFDGRRGHPILVGRSVWPGIAALEAGRTLREFLRDRGEQIEYVVVVDKGVLRDIDTPQDYEEAVAEAGAGRSSNDLAG